MGLHPIEDHHRKRLSFPREKGILPAECRRFQGGNIDPALVLQPAAYPPSLNNFVSQFLKFSLPVQTHISILLVLLLWRTLVQGFIPIQVLLEV